VRVETEARNQFRASKGATPVTIDARRAPKASVFTAPLPPGLGVALGDATSAGDFVCNDTFFRLRAAGTRAYFVHVPNVEPSADAALVGELVALAEKLAQFRNVI
jgi:hypothetical protein